jgi:predicted aldo/keto reductase-like oxidoreductase
MDSNKTINRRKFLGASVSGALGTGMLGWSGPRDPAQESDAKLPSIRQYRTLGRTAFKVSDISAGTGLASSEPGILDALLDAGVNYIDTGEDYGNGRAERTIGEVTKKRDRKSLFITTKLYLSRDRTKAGIVARTRKCLERLQTDYIDCMMIHAAPDMATLKTPGFHEAMDQLKHEGRVRFIGVCNHGTHSWDTYQHSMEDILLAAAEDGRFDVILLAYNFVAREMGEKVLEACGERKIGTTLMKTNPVGNYMGMKSQVEELEKEGKEIPGWIQKTLPKYKELATKAERFIEQHNLKNSDEIRDAAIRFALSNENVNTVCLTFMNFNHVNAYLKLSGSRFTARDGQMLSSFVQGCGNLYCRHACGRCESHCPHGIPVNRIMRYNHYFESQRCEKYAMTEYSRLTQSRADLCRHCAGYCEAACPFGVPIQAKLILAHRRLTLAT